MLRAIQEIKPKFVIAENVFGITNIDGGLVFEQVCIDLENQGYEVQPYIIPAAAKNAPHNRLRCWFIATYSNSNGSDKCNSKNEKYTDQRKQQKKHNAKQGYINGDVSKFTTKKIKKIYWRKFPTESPICSGNDGLPTQLDGITFSKWRAESIKGYGNAIVPQVALELFKQIETIYGKPLSENL